MSKDTTRVRIIDDIAETTREIEVPNCRDAVIMDLASMRRAIRRHEVIRLTVHILRDEIRLHWWSEDLKFAKAVVDAGTIQIITERALQEGRAAL
jgi:hypothetical protein